MTRTPVMNQARRRDRNGCGAGLALVGFMGGGTLARTLREPLPGARTARPGCAGPSPARGRAPECPLDRAHLLARPAEDEPLARPHARTLPRPSVVVAAEVERAVRHESRQLDAGRHAVAPRLRAHAVHGHEHVAANSGRPRPAASGSWRSDVSWPLAEARATHGPRPHAPRTRRCGPMHEARQTSEPDPAPVAGPPAPRARTPWSWIPTLYFAEGLPNAIVVTVS